MNKSEKTHKNFTLDNFFNCCELVILGHREEKTFLGRNVLEIVFNMFDILQKRQ